MDDFLDVYDFADNYDALGLEDYVDNYDTLGFDGYADLDDGSGDDYSSTLLLDKYSQRHQKSIKRAEIMLETMRAMSFEDSVSCSKPNASGRSAVLKSLKAVTVSELEFGKIHYGRVLYGKLSSKPFKTSAVHTVMDDDFGEGVRLSIYNALPPMASFEEVAAKFPKGMKVAIKEPYFKMASDGDSIIRVDDPADVVVLGKNNDVRLKRSEARVVEELEAMRCDGNVLFRKEDWVGAAAKYTDCVAKALLRGPIKSDKFYNVLKLTLSNRAEVMLRMGNFEEAFADAEEALENDPSHLKSLSRLGRAAMELGHFKIACDAFVTVLERSPEEPSVRENLRACKRGLLQSHSSSHSRKQDEDFKRLCSSLSEDHMDCVDRVEIRRVHYGDGRRGLFAKGSIKARMVFFVSNAMAVAKKQPDDSRAVFDMPSCSSIDSSDVASGPLNQCPTLHHSLLVQLRREAVTSKRSLAQLHSLASAGSEEMDIPPMELFDPESNWTPSSTCDLDADRLEEIVRWNSFANGDRSISSTTREGGEGEPVTLGLWVLPSFMNHSCVPNCVHTSIGKTKFVRSTRDIRPGEELTISYLKNLFAGPEDRAQKLSFKCNCERCCLEKYMDAEFAQINVKVQLLAPSSREEFVDGCVGVSALMEPGKRSDYAESMLRSMSIITTPKLNSNRSGGAQAGFPKACLASGKFPATRELANLADRVEAMIGSLDKEIAPSEQGWIRAGCLPAYLAKYQLATMGKEDADAKIDALKLIVDSMMSVQATDGTLTMARLLFREVKGRYNKKNKTFKTLKKLVLRVMQSVQGDDGTPAMWSDMHSTDAKFQYSSFCFTREVKSTDILVFPDV